MASVSGGRRAEEQLNFLADQIGDGGEVRVGFLDSATYPDGTPVATVAALLNFGTSVGKAWPFFSNMIADKSPDWVDRFRRVLKLADYDVAVALERMGEGIAGQLRQQIVDTHAPALEPSTIARKGFGKPLVDTGHMLASVDKEVVT